MKMSTLVFEAIFFFKFKGTNKITLSYQQFEIIKLLSDDDYEQKSHSLIIPKADIRLFYVHTFAQKN